MFYRTTSIIVTAKTNRIIYKKKKKCYPQINDEDKYLFYV